MVALQGLTPAIYEAVDSDKTKKTPCGLPRADHRLWSSASCSD